jgi:hypothetical protein
MGMRVIRSGCDRSSPWLMLGLVSVVLLALGLLSAGCGGGSSDTDTTGTTAVGQTTSTTEQAASMSGTELGDAAGMAWADAMQKLATLLSGKPEAAAIKAQVEQLKEEYVQKLVNLGRQGATLDTAGKAQMSGRIVAALGAAADKDWYASYMDIYRTYVARDVEFGNLLASFNILTQYADFDLLKKQAPRRRLGWESNRIRVYDKRGRPCRRRWRLGYIH